MSRKRLVIDACVGQASGAKACRNVLNTVFDRKYHVIMSIKLWDEWDRHETPFAKSWRKAMKERDRLFKFDIKPKDDIRDKIMALPGVKKDPFLGIKIIDDIHLIETALNTDKTIISLDDTVRGHFKRASKNIDELKIVVWANPHIPVEDVINWLKHGARPEDFRKLGYIDVDEEKYRSGHIAKRYIKEQIKNTEDSM